MVHPVILLYCTMSWCSLSCAVLHFIDIQPVMVLMGCSLSVAEPVMVQPLVVELVMVQAVVTKHSIVPPVVIHLVMDQLVVVEHIWFWFRLLW